MMIDDDDENIDNAKDDDDGDNDDEDINDDKHDVDDNDIGIEASAKLWALKMVLALFDKFCFNFDWPGW